MPQTTTKSRLWVLTLRRDTEAYDDLEAWLTAHMDRELDKLRRVDATAHERQAGVVDGIEQIRFLVRTSRKETTRP